MTEKYRFEIGLLFIFLVIGLSVWFFSNHVAFPEDDLAGLAGAGFELQEDYEPWPKTLVGKYTSPPEAMADISSTVAGIKGEVSKAQDAASNAQQLRNQVQAHITAGNLDAAQQTLTRINSYEAEAIAARNKANSLTGSLASKSSAAVAAGVPPETVKSMVNSAQNFQSQVSSYADITSNQRIAASQVYAAATVTPAGDDDDDAADDDDDAGTITTEPVASTPLVSTPPVVDVIPEEVLVEIRPATVADVAKVGEMMVDHTDTLDFDYDLSDRTMSYYYEDAGQLVEMNYYVDKAGYLYRVLGEGDGQKYQFVSKQTGDVYGHEQELIQALANNGVQDGGSLEFLKTTTDLDGETTTTEAYTRYMEAQNKQADLVGTELRSLDELNKLYVWVDRTVAQIEGLSVDDALLLRRAGMTEQAIQEAYEQIPVQYRSTAAGPLITEMDGINAYLKDDMGLDDWKYLGGSAYSGTYGETAVGRSAEGDVWIQNADGQRIYKEGTGPFAKYYTITNGARRSKDRNSVDPNERELLNEVDKKLKQVSKEVEKARRAGQISDPNNPDEYIPKQGYVQRAQMEEEYKKVASYNRARIVGLLNKEFDKLLGDWSNGAPSWICGNIFALDYYKQDGWTRVPHNTTANALQSELMKNIRTVMIEGEKDEIVEGMYRYAYTIRLLSNTTVQWQTFMMNSCTGENSIEVFYDYGLLRQGEHFLYHYAGSTSQDMIFDCSIEACLFDTACVYFDDTEEPYCVSLVHGEGFTTPRQGIDYDCAEYNLDGEE